MEGAEVKAGTLTACLAAFLLAGCISNRGGSERNEGIAWTVGSTTRREVVERWGAPDAVLGDVWIWRTHRTGGGKLKASFMMIGVTVKNLSSSVVECRLKFAENGRLSALDFVDYTPHASDWSLNPWN